MAKEPSLHVPVALSVVDLPLPVLMAKLMPPQPSPPSS